MKGTISRNICKVVSFTGLVNGSIKIGKNVYIGTLDQGFEGGGVEIGDYTSINDRVIIHSTDLFKVKIGKFCSVANGASFIATMHNYKNLTTHAWKIRPENYVDIGQSINIGHDVWIGKNAIIMKGVNIGTGAVIGGGAIVTKDIPPYAIAVGNPAKVIKYRFNDKIIKQLLDSKRRNWNEEKIKQNYYLEFIKNN